jgi:Trk K+ transport system NAD-binding subunit
MNMYGSLVSPGCILNEQVARQVFDILPEGGPIMVIMDKDGNCWPSNSDEFSKLNISESFLRELCAKIDDGTEPVITHTNDSSIIAAQLATEQTNCGYIIVALPQYNPESTMANINLIETILSQTSLIAKLIEKNNLLYELHNKQSSMHDRG